MKQADKEVKDASRNARGIMAAEIKVKHKKSLRITARGACSGTTEKVSLEDIVVGILAPIMLEVHRHAESEVNTHILAEGGHACEIVLGIRVLPHGLIGIARCKVQEVQADALLIICVWGWQSMGSTSRMGNATRRTTLWWRVAIVELRMGLGLWRCLTFVFHIVLHGWSALREWAC